MAQLWFWPILELFFYELWSLVLAKYFWLDSRQLIGWAILAALFSFFSETNCVSLAVCLVSLSCWNHLSFHLHHPGRQLQLFIKNIQVHFSIHSSLNYMKFPSTMCWRTALHCGVPTPKFHYWHCVFGVISYKHGVFYGIQRDQCWVSSDQTIFSQYFTGLSKCCAANVPQQWWTYIQVMAVECITYCFLSSNCTC